MSTKPTQFRRINFIPAERRAGAIQSAPLLLAVAAVLLLPVASGAARVVRWGAERQLASLTERRDSLSLQVASGVQSQEASDEQRAVASVKKAMAEKVYWADVFKELTNVAPRGIWLTTFDTSVADTGKRVVIAGQGASQAEVTEFFSRLERSYFFRNIQMKFTEAAEEKAQTVFRFQFEGNVYDDGKGGKGGKG